MSNSDDNSPSEAVQAFRREQLAELSTALVFPDIDWSTPELTRRSLADLRDYAESLANSAISWYLRKIVWKRAFARTLNALTIIAAALAALIELLNISTILDSPWAKDIFHSCAGGCSSGRAAEFSLLFVGIAGGFKVIDHFAGNSADWMRFITTASAVNRLLSDFRFNWIELDQTAPLPSPESEIITKTESEEAAPGPGPVPPPGPDPVRQRIALARTFCGQIFQLVEGETSVWAEELKKRMELPGAPHHPAATSGPSAREQAE